MKKLISGALLVGFIIFVIFAVKNYDFDANKKATTGQTTSEQGLEDVHVNFYTEVYELTDEPVRYVVPVGITYELSDRGKPYYHQASNGQKEVWGGTGFHGIKPGVQFFYLERYDSKDAETHVVATYYRMMKN